MANGTNIFPLIDQSLLEAGRQGAELPTRVNPRPQPTLFNETARNLFGEIDLFQGGRRGDLLGRLFGGLLPPSKAQREAFDKLKAERRQVLERARSGVEAQAREAGIRLPRGEPQETKRGQVFEAAARQEPGGLEAFESLMAQGPTGRLARRTQEEELRLRRAENEIRRAMLPLDVQEAIDARLRAAQSFRIDNFRDFSADVRSNVSMASGVQALTSFRQLFETLNNPQATELDIQNSIVALAQILEPGLAVRNDDRIAISAGASPALERMGRWFNQMVSGDIDVGTFKTNAIRSAIGLMGPRVDSLRDTLNFYDSQIAPQIPGVQTGDAARIIGLSPQHIQIMNQIRPISDFNLTGTGQ